MEESKQWDIYAANKLKGFIEESKGKYCSLIGITSTPEKVDIKDIKIMDNTGYIKLKKTWDFDFEQLLAETERLINCPTISNSMLLFLIAHMCEEFRIIGEKLINIQQALQDDECIIRSMV